MIVNVVEDGPTRTDEEQKETRLRMMSKMKANVMRNATKQTKKNSFIVFNYLKMFFKKTPL